jgi:heme/copper-type cytochrome/quinol oxidase subunit 2
MVPYISLKRGDFRLLEVDKPLAIEKDKWYRIIVTSEDVIHRFSLPSLGLKLDGVPGRLNQQSLHPERVGVYYGQCSEICGANHRFMPIVAKIIN